MRWYVSQAVEAAETRTRVVMNVRCRLRNVIRNFRSEKPSSAVSAAGGEPNRGVELIASVAPSADAGTLLVGRVLVTAAAEVLGIVDRFQACSAPLLGPYGGLGHPCAP